MALVVHHRNTNRRKDYRSYITGLVAGATSRGGDVDFEDVYPQTDLMSDEELEAECKAKGLKPPDGD